jgi:integrase
MNHGSLPELQAMLGHSSPAMTLRYAHLAPGHLEKRAQVVQIGKAKPVAAALKLIM